MNLQPNSIQFYHPNKPDSPSSMQLLRTEAILMMHTKSYLTSVKPIISFFNALGHEIYQTPCCFLKPVTLKSAISSLNPNIIQSREKGSRGPTMRLFVLQTGLGFINSVKLPIS